jgi:hypothetical protein
LKRVPGANLSKEQNQHDMGRKERPGIKTVFFMEGRRGNFAAARKMGGGIMYTQLLE